jgi:hypothetical protein
VIPAGVYPARPTRHQWGYTEGGKEQVLVEFQITGDTPEAGTSLAWFGYFTDKTWERTLEALRYCGWEGDDLANLGELDKDVEIVVEHEDDESGVTRAKVRWVNKPGGGRVQLKKPMSEGELRHFAASMKNRAKNARPTKTRSSAASDDTPPPGGDDIPF